MRSQALVVSGPPGVGKTTIGWRVFDLCTTAGEDPAFIDLDFMGAAWPAPLDDPHQSRLKATNAAAVWSNCQVGGSRRLVVAGVVETPADRQLLADALGLPVVICRLSASVETLGHRIEGRGRDHGADLVKLVRRAEELQTQLTNGDIADFVTDTVDRSVDMIAEEVVRRWQRSGEYRIDGAPD